jgi:hypothetical protein
MWKVIYIAVNRAQADMLKNLLTSEGIMADTRPAGLSMLGDGIYELLVLESEAEEAKEILCEMGGNL